MNSYLTQLLLPAIVAILSSSVMVAVVQYYSRKRESDANAKATNVTAEISVGEAWRKYAEKQEEIVKNLIAKHDELDKKYNQEIALKDQIIEGLKKEIALKDRTILSLEQRLTK